MWKPEHRRLAERHCLRYPSDLTDAEWALVEPMIPPAEHGGRPRHVNIREVLNAIFYVLSTGCQWRALPKDLPPKSRRTFTSRCGTGMARWSASTTNCMSLCASRKAENRTLTAAIIDSQSARAAQKAALRFTRKALMRARRLRAANAISLSIRSACC